VNLLAELTLRERRGVMVVRLDGEVDASNADGLRKRLLDAVSNQARGMVLDLTPTTYLDSAGVQLIVELAQRLRRRQLGLRVVVEPRTLVADVLEMVRIEEVAGSAADVNAALQELAGPTDSLRRSRLQD
jgi:anti-anti-sigma factor